MGSQNYMFIVLIVLTMCAVSSIAQLQSPPLQDFCVADLNNHLLLGGPKPCKDPMKVEDKDFYWNGSFSVALVETVPGLNTLGLRMNKLSFGPSDINPLHFHARAAELVYVVEGTLEAGFVSAAPDYRLFNKILNKGDVFVVPFGLVHFQLNVGQGNATAEALVFFNSDKPGVTGMRNVMFGTTPQLPVDVVAKSLQVDESIIKLFQTTAN